MISNINNSSTKSLLYIVLNDTISKLKVSFFEFFFSLSSILQTMPERWMGFFCFFFLFTRKFNTKLKFYFLLLINSREIQKKS
jgi:hypothetical protein